MKEKIPNLICLPIIAGTLIGLGLSISQISSHHYFLYGMPRLALLVLQNYLNSWIILLTFVFLTIYLLFIWLGKPIKIGQAKLIPPLREVALAIIILLAIFNLGIFLDAKINAPKGPNVVLIAIDALRQDHVGCYGYTRNTTPNIDAVAREGIIFERAFSSAPHTLFSFHSILTGLYPLHHRVMHGSERLDNAYVTFAELMKNSGYKTAGFVSGSFLNANFGFNQGFDLYVDSISSSTYSLREGNAVSLFNKPVLSWLKKNRKNKFFLFLHYLDPHCDYTPPAPYSRMFDPDYRGSVDGSGLGKNGSGLNLKKEGARDFQHLVALYDTGIFWSDRQAGEILDALKKARLEEETLLVIFADHGEELLEHGQLMHGMNLYDENLRIPLIFKIPGLSRQKRIEEPVSSVDILPTVLDILKIKNPTYAGFNDGKSLLPAIYSQKTKGRGKIYSELPTMKMVAVMEWPWKLIYDTQNEDFEFYNLESDPQEKNNLFSKKIKEEEVLKKELMNWLAGGDKKWPQTPKARMDQRLIEELKSLGYVN